ncbi:cytochrome C biogenesis protein CcsA [Azospirillum baldaniorum]|uniref:Cytochrome C biogenesis protein CcsA n=4 Tax=Azospirillum TaxID=191 RepID=A0A060DPC0_9PROT|nr:MULTISPECIES: cytochrome-c peroxidase [Azospirillum]TWA80156.1 cytochrome c peroxidase [Azospirillum brasilense]AIB12948.1 cytochrome C biogenesis protein CcsA [Azospirillum argentinense]AWJ88330.1 cytochrome C biogenesis protein CcsA [Azospirillum baldaniorum]EZQ07192.1 cytochrome C biogenesis protein CcsA [Azospirillum argentinense]KAA1055405.1 Cytochrome c551 peroxidase [Azospirillum argentinense]
MSMRAAVSFAAMLAASVATFGVPAFAADEPISPIEPAKVTNPGLVELGKKLYFDPRLSKSGFISCNSCHNLSMGGTDNLKTSIGHNWQQGPINSPTVLNSSLNVAQFWDGRALTLQEQAGGPIANPGEMGSTHALAVEVLRSIPEYQKEFGEVFGETKITIEEVTKAIAAFEETLVTPNSRFDQWLKGDKKALTTVELEGYELFKDSGCTACHNGSAVGGNTFQKMGVVEPYKTNNPAEGRIAVTKEEADRFNFKVPTLRNVALTYPYFHDGEAATLSDAVDVMGRIQLGKKFSPDENGKIVAFLKTLTGDQPSFALPILPPSTDKTPKPHPFD